MPIKPGRIELLTLDTIAEFTWGFSDRFLLETEHGNFIWSDPDYNGDNSIKPYHGDPRNFVEPGFSGRCKGTYRIRHYCGEGAHWELPPPAKDTSHGS
jgi:hypothetical protein